jgi:phospholipid/cholesterol/gamma-HCH transport system substrate-binding protein
MRQHSLGPYPIDPNLIAQGIPPDDRVDFGDRLYAPVEGTPLAPGAVPAGTPPDAPPPGAPPPPAPVQVPLAPPPPGNSFNGVPIPPAPVEPAPVAPAAGEPAPVPDGGAVPAAPSAFGGNDSGGPSVATAQYDPLTGSYLAPDGQLQQLTNVAAGTAPKSWKDLLPI